MWGKIVASQVLALPSAWAATTALVDVFQNVPSYVPVGIWGLVTLYVLSKLKE